MKLVSRSAWKARTVKNLPTNITPGGGGIAIHYDGGKGKLTPSSHSKCAAIVRSIQNYHMDSNGWLDIAYSYLVCQHGYVYEGRGLNKRTAANGSNSGNQFYYAVCGLVNDADTPTPEMIQGFKDACQYLRINGGAGSKVVGHKDLYNTSCPGKLLYAKVKDGTFKKGGNNSSNDYPGHLIKKGSTGSVVKKIQQRLIRLGYKLPKYGADGSFGSETESAIETFQKKNKLSVDGIVGPKTWAKIF